MIPAALALTLQFAHCAPGISVRTMAGIVQVESGGDPLAIGDNTSDRSYHLSDRAAAEAFARRLLREGHSLDLGLAQINDANLLRVGLTLTGVFDPCRNLRAAAQIFREDYVLARRRFGASQLALRRALGMYNTGRLDAGGGYAERVLAAAGNQQDEPFPPGPAAEDNARTASFLIRVTVLRRTNATQVVAEPARAPLLVGMHLSRMVKL